jgi:hypothetical protein
MKTKISLGLIYAGLVLWIITIWSHIAISHDQRQKAFGMAHESAREADRDLAGQVVHTLPEISFYYLSAELRPKN